MQILSSPDQRSLSTFSFTDNTTRTADPTGNQGVPILVEYSPTFNYAGNVPSLIGPQSTTRAGPAALIEVTGTSTYNYDQIIYGLPPIAFQNKHTIKNNAGVARKLTPSWSFISAPGYVADGATVQFQKNDVGYYQSCFWSQPLWHTINSGTIDGGALAEANDQTFTTAGFTSQFWAQGNVTIPTYIGFNVLIPKVTERLPGFDAVDGIVENAIGLNVPRMTQGTIENIGIRCNTQVKLHDDEVTFTSAPDPAIKMDGTHTLNYASAVGPSPIAWEQTVIYKQDSSVFGVGLFRSAPTIKNDPASAGIDTGTTIHFQSAPVYKADSHNDVTGAHIALADSPTLTREAAGAVATMTVITARSMAIVNTGMVASSRTGYLFRDATGSGTVTTQVGFDIESITKGTKNRGIRFQGAGGIEFADSTEPTGSLGSSAECLVYFRNKKIVFKYNDGGTVRYKYLDLSGTGVTWVHTTSAP